MANTDSKLKKQYIENVKIQEIDDEYIVKELEKAEKEADDINTKYYSHEEVFNSLRRIIEY